MRRAVRESEILSNMGNPIPAQTILARAVVFVSLSSRSMTSIYLECLARVAEVIPASLSVIFLDHPEVINQTVLYGHSPAEALVIVQSLCSKLRLELTSLGLKNVLLDAYSKYAEEPSFQRYIEGVMSLYNKSRKFRNHCENQAFRNLQPRLRELGVHRRNHELVGKLAQYILQEVALKLYIADQSLMDIEMAPEPEMEVMIAIYQGKYPELGSLASRKLPVRVVEPRM
jgi:hypothetical protein